MSKNGKVLYVGKAKNLNKRLKSYTQTKRLSLKNQQLVLQAQKLKFKKLNSELEALLVEAELIKLHQPKFNILLKDDKNYLYIYISNEKYPRVLLKRKPDLNKIKLNKIGYKNISLGPFTSAYQLKQVLKIVRKVFKFCNLKIKNNKACFYYQLDLCSGACINKISPEDYQKNIKNLVLFLRGKNKKLIKNLKLDIKNLIKDQKFEQAAKLKTQIDLINNILNNAKLEPDLTLPLLTRNKHQEQLLFLQKILSEYLYLPKNYPLDRIEGYDVSNILGQAAAVSLVTFSHGLPDKKNYKLFNIKKIKNSNDYQMLQEALIRRQKHPEWGKPNLIVIDGGRGQLRAVKKIWHWETPVISLVKNPDRVVMPTRTGVACNALTYQIIKLPPDHPALKLLQYIRDESHRFAKKQHIKLRNKDFINV